MAGEPDIAVRLRIRGRVQGVFYRAWAAETARSLGLSGWVRNRSDGSVEALASGTAEAVERFVILCRSGPPAARVEAVEREPADTVAGGFEKRTDA